MTDDSFRAVTPIRPAAAYIGGKRRLGEQLARRIEAVAHETYAEPFVGMGGVFFRRRWAPRREVVNDVSRDVATLFRILQRHYPQFMETLKFQIASRAEFERLAASNPDTLTDLERAGRFLYLQRLAFGGKVAGRSFGVDTNGPSRFDVTKLGPLLDEIHDRLAGVVIECLPWPDFVARYDSPTTLFYLDPPYWGSETDYGAGVFSRAPGRDRRPLHPVGQRRPGNARRLRPLRDRERGHALHYCRRQMVRCRGDRRHRAGEGADTGSAGFAVDLKV